MKTVVYQSYRTHDVAPWIATCMGTVRAWAQARGYDYEFIDDGLFDRVPAWFREKVAGQICPMADYARLAVARELLARGYERTVWVDADLLVFAPNDLAVDGIDSFSYCYELWLARDKQGALNLAANVNNAITVFVKGGKGETYLDFFIDAAERTAASLDVVPKIAISTQFLTRLRRALPFQLLMNVGLFSPLLLADIASGTSQVLPAYGAALRKPLACANLCASFVGETKQGVILTEEMYEAVVEKCLESRGDIVNRFVKSSTVLR